MEFGYALILVTIGLRETLNDNISGKFNSESERTKVRIWYSINFKRLCKRIQLNEMPIASARLNGHAGVGPLVDTPIRKD